MRGALTPSTGAVTRGDFEKAIRDTPVVDVRNASEVVERLRRCSNVCLNANADWKAKSKALTEIRGMLLSDSACVVPTIVEQYICWEECFIKGMKELRSSLCREYCITVALLCLKLGHDFFRQVNLLFRNLMHLTQSSAKIMASCAMVTAEYIAEYVQMPKLINTIANEMTSKSNSIRRTVFQMCNIILNFWPMDILSQQIKIIMEIIKAGCTDADVQCRQYGRDDYKRQKMLNDVGSLSTASSTKSIGQEKFSSSSHLGDRKNQYMNSRSHSDVNVRQNTGNFSTPKSRNNVPVVRNKNPACLIGSKIVQSTNRPVESIPKFRQNIVSNVNYKNRGNSKISYPESTLINKSNIPQPAVASIFGPSRGVNRIAPPSSLMTRFGYSSSIPDVKSTLVNAQEISSMKTEQATCFN